MTREEAREFLLSIANKLGDIGVEDLTDRDGKRMIEAIKALEEPEQPQWIQCSEGLPGEYMSFYATVKSLVDNRERWVIEGMYTKFWQWGKIPMIDRGEAEVIAWMPKHLPEPYKEEANKPKGGDEG